MGKRIAVITDTVARDNMFELWYRYYGNLFGKSNLFVVSYKNLLSSFRNTELGGIWEIAEDYNDQTRSKVISKMVSSLLLYNDYVVRCDVDEFLLADPRISVNLRDYIERLDKSNKPYVTARGYEIIQTNSESELDYTSPIIINQRKSCFRNAALNKTCITSIPIEWNGGFHGCDVFPYLSELTLFHLKYADIDARLKWFRTLTESTPNNEQVRTYCEKNIESMSSLRQNFERWPIVTGWDNFESRMLDEEFRNSVTINPIVRHYMGTFFRDNFCRAIPSEFEGKL